METYTSTIKIEFYKWNDSDDILSTIVTDARHVGDSVLLQCNAVNVRMLTCVGIMYQSKYTLSPHCHGVRSFVFPHINSHEVYLLHGGVVLCSVRWRHCTSCIQHDEYSSLFIDEEDWGRYRRPVDTQTIQCTNLSSTALLVDHIGMSIIIIIIIMMMMMMMMMMLMMMMMTIYKGQ